MNYREQLFKIINTFNEFNEPCHYKLRQAINEAKREIPDSDSPAHIEVLASQLVLALRDASQETLKEADDNLKMFEDSWMKNSTMLDLPQMPGEEGCLSDTDVIGCVREAIGCRIE